MKRCKKLLAIVMLTIIAVCCSAISAVFAFANSVVPGSNLTTWGDAESGDSNGLTAVTTEKFEGEKSFEFAGPSKTISIKNMAYDGTLYKVSLKVKAATSGTTFSVYAIGTHKDANEAYAYTSHKKTQITLTEEWTDYVFYVSNRYDAESKTVYYSDDGITEKAKGGIESPFANFQLKFETSATVYMDNIAFEKVAMEDEEVSSDVVYSEGFESGLNGFAPLGETIVALAESEGCAHSGSKAMQITYNTTSKNGNAQKTNVSTANNDWISTGGFVELSYYTKRVSSDVRTRTSAMMSVYGADAEGALNTKIQKNITLFPSYPTLTDEWMHVTTKIGVYSNGTTAYCYDTNNGLVVMDNFAGYYIGYKANLLVGVTVGDSYVDDITITKTAVVKDVTVTVVDSEGNAVTGATLVVKDADGNVLATQPEITEEAGVYTVKGLSFANFAQKYTVCVGENSCEVDFINAEGEITATATEGGDQDNEDEEDDEEEIKVVPGSNITTWGDAESGDAQGLTAVTTEKFAGEKSFELSGKKQVRIKISANNTLYKVSLRVKAKEADTTFSLVAVGTHKDVNEAYAYTYHGGTEVTLTEEWTEYVFCLAYRFDESKKTVYYSIDGKNEETKENIKSALLGFDLIFNSSATVYMDNIAVEQVDVKSAEVVVGEILYQTGFEDDAHGFGVGGSGYSSGVIVNKTEDANVYEGNQALKLNGHSRNFAIVEDKTWITKGDFFVYKAYAKLAEGTSASAAVELALWSADANGSNWTQDINMSVMPHTTLSGDTWVELTYVFSVYGNGSAVYAYHKDGLVEKLNTANNYIASQAYFTLVSLNGTIYIDNVVIAKTTMKKDAVVSIFDMAGNVVAGANLVVKDADGNVLDVQPEIVENEEGVYTIKDLEYSSLAQKYIIGYEEGSCVVDFINAECEVTLDSIDGEEILGDPIFSYGFEDGLNDFFAEEGGGGSCVLDDENAHEGENSLKVNGIWTRKEFNDGWIQAGYFFKFSAWVKIASGSPQACAQMFIWGERGEDDWEMCDTRICALTYTTISNDWTYVSGIFGVYSDGTTAYAYHNNGILEELSDLEGYNIAYKVVFDLGATVGGSIYYDEVSVVPVKAYKNATVTIYGAENPEIVVCDADGVALEKQPKIAESDGIYTIKALGFENFEHKYIVKVYDNGEEYGSHEVTFINSDAIVASPFSGTVIVKDVNGNPVTDATIVYGDNTVTENENGVYTLVDLLTTTNITVKCEGLLPGYSVITPEESEVVVVVKEEHPVVDVDGNKIFDGNFEDGFAHNLMKQKADAVITNKDQYSGKKSMVMTANDVSARVLARTTGIEADGTVYYFEVMAKSTNNAIFSMGVMLTGYDDTGSYCYPSVTSEIVALTNEWQKISITFSFRFDEATNKLYYAINDEDEIELNKPFASIAAFDMMFSVSDGGVVYIDDIVILETYTGTVRVLDKEGNALEDATFVVTDFAGNTLDIIPDYNMDTKEYVFENLAGNVTVVATAGGKTYSAVTLSKALNSLDIEASYNITLTLKDQYGQAVVGAIVYARKLLTTVGTFVDNGDGTYTLSEVMGTVSIVVVVDGYSFSRQDGVTVENSVLTMVGENYNEPEVEESKPTTKPSKPSSGCGGAIDPMSLFAISALFAVGVVLKKKED